MKDSASSAGTSTTRSSTGTCPRADKASDIKPGLATEWHIDPANHKRWLFTLRQGVKFHDGCDFTADDVIWNFGRIADPKAPQFYTQQFALSRAYLTNFESIEKVDDHTVAINNKFEESLFPYDMAYVLMISRCRAEALHYDWDQYAAHPSGTGPYMMASVTPHERMELTPNAAYWDKARVPKQDRLILLPMPEAATRTAALLSGQVNFIEGARPRRDPAAEERGHDDRDQYLSAQLAVHPELHPRPVHRPACTPGRQLRHQP